MRPLAFVCALLMATATLASGAIADTGNEGPDEDDGGEGGAAHVTIVSSLPLTGAQSVHAHAVENGIRMAFERARWRAGSSRITYVPLDDGSLTRTPPVDPAKEIANATRAASDPSVVAWIGPFNSPAAKRSIPILCQAGLGMVSPSNTVNGLTKAAPYNDFPDEPQRYYPNGCARNYARVAMRDPVEGDLAAVLTRSLGGTRAFVIKTSGPFAGGTASDFVARASSAGITVVGEEQVAPNAAPYAGVASRVASSGADTVFVSMSGGQGAGAVVRAVRAAAPSVRVVGNDAFVNDPGVAIQAGPVAEGIYGLNGPLVPDSYSGRTAAWRARYEAEFGPLLSPWALYGFDAANVVLAAVRRTGHHPDRDGVRAAIIRTRDFRGLLGMWSFDADGDTTLALSSYSRFVNGQWTVAGTVTLP